MTPRSALPPVVVLTIALIASWALHVPVYVGLGLLSKMLEQESPAIAAPPMEIEIISTENPDSPPPGAEDEEPPPDEPERIAEPEPEPEPELVSAPEPPSRPPTIPQIAATAPPPPPPPPPPPANLRSVEHRSQNPDVEPPPDAQHLAEENSRVEEEMMARIRNPNLNDPDPQPASPTEASTDPAEGDSAEERMAELRESEGTDAREPTPEETRQPPRPPTRRPSTSPTPSVSEAAPGDGRRGGAEEAAPPRRAAGGGARTRGGGEASGMTEIVVNDGNGSFTVRVRRRPEGEGDGDEGGERLAGRGAADEGEGRAAGRAGRGRRRARGGSARGRGTPNLRLSWTDFASIYGEDELERERDLAIAQRRSRTRGASRQETWRRFRAAIENYDVRVRPGNQTALNTRADPFASYIAAMHRRIHPRFALGYLTNVPSTVDESFRGNPNMHANLELGIDAEGRVDHVSVVSTSGDILFDLGAFESVMGAQPFPAPPSQIRSPDGLVYMQWAFYRNQRQCGTFNARAFILANAPSRRERRPDEGLHPDVALPPRGTTD